MSLKWLLWLPRVVFRRQTLATVLTTVSGISLLSLGVLLRDRAADPPALAEPDPPLTVLPAAYSGPPDHEDVAPDTARLRRAYQQAGTATEGPAALVRSLVLLSAGCENLEAIPDYTATFVRRERIDGIIGQPESISLKLRHRPLALYLHWTDGPKKGRELIYVEGQNDGDMIVHSGGWKGRLLPTMKLNPHGAVALSYARHPVTELGIVSAARRIIEKRTVDAARGSGYRFHIDEHAEVEGRPALRCELVFDSSDVSDFYRKSVYFIDREMLIPVAFSSYAWPESPDVPEGQLDEETVVEDYLFSNLVFRARLADADFDTANEQYRFRK